MYQFVWQQKRTIAAFFSKVIYYLIQQKSFRSQWMIGSFRKDSRHITWYQHFHKTYWIKYMAGVLKQLKKRTYVVVKTISCFMYNSYKSRNQHDIFTRVFLSRFLLNSLWGLSRFQKLLKHSASFFNQNVNLLFVFLGENLVSLCIS